MPPPSVFSALGLFVREGFLSPAERADVERAMRESVGGPAGVYGEATRGRRHASELSVDAGLAHRMAAAVAALGADLQRHFHVRLSDAEPPSFLRYVPGDHYAAHRDRPDARVDAAASRRAVSVVIFVNGPDGPDGFEGGRLRCYGLLGEGLAEIGMDMDPVAGTLVAFESGLLHEVTPVAAGTRYSIASWFSAHESG